MTPEEEEQMRKTMLDATNHMLKMQNNMVKRCRIENTITEKNKKVRYSDGIRIEEIKDDEKM